MSTIKEVTPEQVNWAYAILGGFIEAFNKVAASTNKEEKLALAKQLTQEYIENMPKLCEAFMILSKPEHVGLVHRFFKSYAGVFESWRKKPRR